MHVFFINKYQTEFTESIDKTYIYIYIFFKHGLLNFHDTFPYLYTVAEAEPKSQASLQSHLLSPDSPKPREMLITNFSNTYLKTVLNPFATQNNMLRASKANQPHNYNTKYNILQAITHYF